MKKPGKTLVIGCESLLGRGFLKAYREYYPDTLGTHYRSLDPTRHLDLYSPSLDPLQLQKGEYGYAVIAAANTNLALCEQEKSRPFRCNVEGILGLVRELVKWGIQPILFSTAYVFDGIYGGYDEFSKTNPINEYGRQKEILEKTINNICGNDYLMIRGNRVFDMIKGSDTLIDQMFSHLKQGKRITAAFDQVFCPILLEDLVRGVIALQVKGCKGLYNLCSNEVWTRLELANEVAKTLVVDPELVQPISLDEVKSPFYLPKRTNMSCEKFYGDVDFQMTSMAVCIKKINEFYCEEVTNAANSIIREATVG